MSRQFKNLLGAGIGALTARLINGVVFDSLTATGTTQATALALPGDVNVITSAPSGGGVILPASPQPGDELLIVNADPSNALLVYPALGGSIQGQSVNAAVSVAAGQSVTFIARVGSLSWIVLASAAGSGSGLVNGTDIVAPGNFALAGPTTFPLTVSTVNFYPADHIVGDTLRAAVFPAVVESGGLILPSGTPTLNATTTLSATPATNISNLTTLIAGVTGTGFLFLRVERPGLTGYWTTPAQFGTSSVPSLTSSTALLAYETVPLLASLTFSAPIQKLVLRGNDQSLVELVNAKPGSTFQMQWTGGAAKSRPLRDWNFDNVADLSLEATGLNGLIATASITVSLNALTASAFDFADVTGVALNAYGISPTTVTVAGLPAGVSAPVTCGTGTQVSKNGGAYASTGVTVQNGDTLNAEVLTPGTASRTVGTVSYANQTDNFNADNVGYTPATTYGWDGASGTGGTGGANIFTLSGTNNKIVTQTVGSAPSTIFGTSSSIRTSGKRFIVFKPTQNAGGSCIPGLRDTVTGNVMYWGSNGLKTDSSSWGGMDSVRLYSNGGATLGMEVDFTGQTITLWQLISGTWTKNNVAEPFIASFGSSLEPWANIGYSTGQNIDMDTAAALPSGVASGCVDWGAP